MNKVNKATFLVVIFVVAIILSISIYGVDFGGINISGADKIRYGIDIRGGVEVIYAPKDLGRTPSSLELQSARSVLETRLDGKNILDREITVDSKNGEILLRFPWKSDETEFNPQVAIAELGETARLTFRDPQGNIIVEGKNVKKSSPTLNPQTNEHMVQLEFDDVGAKAFSDATGRLIGQQIMIYMDETLFQAPQVNEKIPGGSAVIDNIGSAAEAKELADKINSGALPFSMEAKSYSTISPTLGSNALNIMLQAGTVIFALICLFMIAYYRLPGVIACVGLTLQFATQILLLTIPQITLTLPGIAGILLSLGMGVDTNIIISERIKEEINNKKTLGAAIELGYKRAFSAVFDGNITTVIIAIVLMIFGSGSILSFGYTLLTGVLMNFISGITASKLMVTSLSKYDCLKKPIFYGARRVSE